MPHTRTRTLEDAVEGLRFPMVTTSDLTSRPLTCVRAHDQHLWFLVDKTADWMKRIAIDPTVGLSFADPKSSDFVSVVGRAEAVHDREVLERLWNPAAEAWFNGVDDPKLAALRVDVEQGQYWDGPDSRIARTLAFARARATGNTEAMGEAGDVHP
ncbi:MAG: pyridoxamine 5'-phosphate oxidase family protein [Planctomycetota bacterium]